MESLFEQLGKDLRNCRLCASELAKYYVDPSESNERVVPRPIVSDIKSKPILLIGQAPGLSEYRSEKPFQGPAGQKIRKIFSELGITEFDTSVYSSAVVKCFPGRKCKTKHNPTSRNEDRAPTPSMIRNCTPFLKRQIALVNPRIIVTLGSLPLTTYLNTLKGVRTKAKLADYVGSTEYWSGRQVVFFPHTSSASQWLNSSINRDLFKKAKELLRNAFVEHGIIAPPS